MRERACTPSAAAGVRSITSGTAAGRFGESSRQKHARRFRMNPESQRWREERDTRLAGLRTRARAMRLTIKSSRGTGTGYYHLQAGSSDEFHPVVCDGLDTLERWIADFERAVRQEPAPPSPERLQELRRTIFTGQCQ